jgi:hypothetical protein
MRHLKKFNESKYDDKQQDIEYAIGFIIDKLGDPIIKRERWGENMKFTYTWNLGLNISHLNKAEDLINRIKDIMEEMDDLIAAKDRLLYYDIYMSIDTRITIVFIPKEVELGNFKFLIGQNGREIQLKKSEIERFFKSKDIIIIKTEETYNEYSEIGGIELTLSKGVADVSNEFRELLLSELQENEDIDVDIFISGITHIEIYPESEKRYVTI